MAECRLLTDSMMEEANSTSTIAGRSSSTGAVIVCLLDPGIVTLPAWEPSLSAVQGDIHLPLIFSLNLTYTCTRSPDLMTGSRVTLDLSMTGRFLFDFVYLSRL